MRVANERNRKSAGVLAALLAVATLSLVACKDFSFFTELGYKGGLSISPRTVEVVAGGTVQFSASSGVEPYTYSIAVSLDGTYDRVDPMTGLYQAPAIIGPETVVVQDAVGTTAPAYITVVAAAGSILGRICAMPAAA